MAGDAAAAARSFDEQLAAAVAGAQSAVSAAEAPEKTDEQIVEAIASAEAAAEANGIAPATRYAIDRVKIKWQRFVERFGATYGFDGRTPTMGIVTHFVTFMFQNRETWSALGRKGLGKAAFVSAAYHLPRFVFPELGYDGWVGLDPVQLATKSAPYRKSILEKHKALTVSSGDISGTGKGFEKRRWCRSLCLLAQDRMMEDTANLNATASNLAIVSFIDTTCSRSGDAPGRGVATVSERRDGSFGAQTSAPRRRARSARFAAR